MIETIMNKESPWHSSRVPDSTRKESAVGGFHILDLLVILIIGLVIFGPKALQSMAHGAGKGVGQAKALKEKARAELPMEEIAKVSEHIAKVPTNPHQVIRLLVTPEVEKKQESKQD